MARLFLHIAACFFLLAAITSAAPIANLSPGWLRDKWDSAKSKFSSGSSSSSKSKDSDNPPPYSAGDSPPSYKEATRSSSSGSPPSNLDNSRGSSTSSISGFGNWGLSRWRRSNRYRYGDRYGYGYNDRYRGTGRHNSTKEEPMSAVAKRNIGIIIGSIIGFFAFIAAIVVCRRKTKAGGDGKNRGCFGCCNGRRKTQRFSKMDLARSLRRYSKFYKKKEEPTEMENLNGPSQTSDVVVILPPPVYHPSGQSTPYNEAAHNPYEQKTGKMQLKVPLDDGAWQQQGVTWDLNDPEPGGYSHLPRRGGQAYEGVRGHMRRLIHSRR